MVEYWAFVGALVGPTDEKGQTLALEAVFHNCERGPLVVVLRTLEVLVGDKTDVVGKLGCPLGPVVEFEPAYEAGWRKEEVA